MNIKQNNGRIEKKKKMLNVAALLVAISRVVIVTNMFVETKEALVATKKESRTKAATGTS